MPDNTEDQKQDQHGARDRSGDRPVPSGARAGQEHFVAETDEQGLGAVDAVDDDSAPASMWGEAWK